MKCLHCQKELEPREGKKKVIRKYCDKVCATRYRAREWYEEHKENEEFKEKNRKRFQKWYPNNKERQNENVKRYYTLHKEEWSERRFTNRHKKNILKYINSFCSCGKPIKIIHIKKYGNKPLLKVKGKENLELLEKYTKENLIGVCSRLCLENYKYLDKLLKEKRK